MNIKNVLYINKYIYIYIYRPEKALTKLRYKVVIEVTQNRFMWIPFHLVSFLSINKSKYKNYDRSWRLSESMGETQP